MVKLSKGDKIGPYPYHVIKQLGEGEGGMSIVYLAWIGEVDQPKTDQLVALKIANVGTEYEEFYRKTLDNEVEHLRKLTHPRIVRLERIRGQTLPPNPIYSARTNLPGKPWFSVMEYLAGGSLAELLKRHKKLNPGLALRIAHKLAKTLEYIHHENCVHLDIKPENIVFKESLSKDAIVPVLIDFGIARTIGQTGLEAGTRMWLPPERLVNLENKDLPPNTMATPHPAMDIYALGLLLYRMLTGALPFEDSQQSIAHAILRENAAPPSTYERTVKPELDQLILSAIAKKPHDRPTATNFANELENLITRPEYSYIKVYKKNLIEGVGEVLIFKNTIFFVLIVVLGMVLGVFLYSEPQIIEDLKQLFATSTITPTIAVTATKAPHIVTTIPIDSIIPTKT